MLNFYAPSELKKLGLGSFGEKVIIKKTVQFYNPSKIHIGNKVIIEDFSILSAKEEIIIGNNVHIGSHVSLFGRYGIVMENYSSLGNRVTLFTESDDYSGNSLTNATIPLQFKPKFNFGPILIKEHGIVGTNSTILPGIVVGEGVAVGAHTLVTKNLEPWSIYVGTPAKKLKNRQKDLLVLAERYRESDN